MLQSGVWLFCPAESAYLEYALDDPIPRQIGQQRVHRRSHNESQQEAEHLAADDGNCDRGTLRGSGSNTHRSGNQPSNDGKCRHQDWTQPHLIGLDNGVPQRYTFGA
jgi:hypothetical protein